MRKLLLSVLAIISLTCEAQTKSHAGNGTPYSYSIGLKAFSYEEFPKILDQTNSDSFRSSAWNGFILKYNDNQISYRLSGNFYSKALSFRNGCDNCEILAGRLNDNHIKLGFEKNLTYNSIQPYFGIDIGIKRSVFNGSTQNNEALLNNSGAYNVKTEKNGLSLSPLLGIKLNLINHFTIAAESTVDIYYSYERQEKAYKDAPGSRTLNKYYKWEYLLKPVGMLSLQYNFGEVY